MSRVRTSKVKDRRELRFGRLHELVDDVMSFDGEVQATGNWTPAQIVTHVAMLIEYSLDGFPVREGPLLLRGIAKMMRSRFLIKPWKPGLKFPRKMKFLQPPDDVTWEQAVARLKKVVQRIDEGGERMIQRSPILGYLEHEEWIQLHCRHGEMHFSFLRPAERPAATEAAS